MKQIYLMTMIAIFSLISMVSYATDHFTEYFTAGPSEYYTGLYTYSSGLEWDIANAKAESAANSYGGWGSAVRFYPNETSYVISPSVNTVGSVTFYYREVNAVGGGAFSVQKSVGGGAFTEITSQVFSGTTYQEITVDVNDNSNNIRIKVVANVNTFLIIDDMTITAMSSDPELQVSPNTLSGFNYIEGAGPSAEQSYNLSGSNLTGFPDNITVTAPADYEVSLSAGTGYAASISVPYASATLASTPVYVRLKSGLSVGTYNSEIVTNAGGGASTVTVTCDGSVSDASTPELIALPIVLSDFNYNIGEGPSAEQSYNLSGTNLTGYPDNITISAPTDYEISLSSGSGFTNSLNVPYASETLSATTIYVRLKSGLVVGTYNSEYITISGGGATDVDVTCNGSVLDISADPCLAEDFSGFTTGSHEYPSTSDASASLDTYTQTTGWEGYKIYSANGEIKIGTASVAGYIITPTIDLSDNGTVEFDYAQWASDVSVVQVFHAPDGVNFVQIGSDLSPTTDFQSTSIEITGGTVSSKIKIGTDVKRCYLDNINVYCGGTTPVLSVNPTDLSGFTFIEGNGPSSEQSFEINGTDLDGSNVNIIPPTNYEVSFSAASGYQSSALEFISFDGSSTTIYVRLKADLVSGTYNAEEIQISGGGADDVSVSCSGYVDENVGYSIATSLELAVYPNPGNTILYVKPASADVDYAWQLMDVTGKLLEAGKATGRTTIDVSGFEAGMYFMKFISGENEFVKKLTVK